MYFNCLLPPANEVWDKVMFLDLSLFTGVCLRGGGLHPGRGGSTARARVCIPGVLGRPPTRKQSCNVFTPVCMFTGGGGGLHLEGLPREGVCIQEVCLWGPSSRGGVCIQGRGRLYPEGLGSPPEIEKECLLVNKAVTWIQKAYAKTRKYLGSV